MLRWSEIKNTDTFKNSDRETREVMRTNWLKKAEKNVSKDAFSILQDKVIADDIMSVPVGGIEPMQRVAQTPQVIQNPEPFDINLNQMAGLPQGMDVRGAALSPQEQQPPAEMQEDTQVRPLAQRMLGKVLSMAPGTGVIKAQVEDPSRGVFKNALIGAYKDFLEKPIEALKAYGVPQTVLLGGQELTKKKLKETEDIPIPKDPIGVLGYLIGKQFSPGKALDALNGLVMGGKENVTINDLNKQVTGKTLQEEHGKIKGTLIDILGTAASDPAMAVDSYLAMAKSAKSMKSIMKLATEVVRDDSIQQLAKREPAIQKSLVLLRDSLPPLRGKGGGIIQGAGKQPAGALPAARVIALPDKTRPIVQGAGRQAVAALEAVTPSGRKAAAEEGSKILRKASVPGAQSAIPPIGVSQEKYLADLAAKKALKPKKTTTLPLSVSEAIAKPTVKTLSPKKLKSLGDDASKKLMVQIESGGVQEMYGKGTSATYRIKMEGTKYPIDATVSMKDLSEQGSDAIVTAMRSAMKRFAVEQNKTLPKKKTGELIKDAKKAVTDIFGKERGSFSTGKKTPQQEAAEERLKAISEELIKRFKKAGTKKFKDFRTFLTEAAHLTPEEAAMVMRQTTEGGKQAVPSEIVAIMDGATDDVQKVERVLNASEAESKRIYKQDRSVKKAYEALKRATVDVSGNIKSKLLKLAGDEGRSAVIAHDLTRGAKAKAGRIIDEASKEIYKGLSKEEERILNKMIVVNRELTIAGYKPDFKHLGGLPPEAFKKYMNSIPKEIKDKLQGRMDAYSKLMRKQLIDLYKGGLISEKELNAMVSKGDYSPRNLLKFVDPDRSYPTLGGKLTTVPDSGIKALKEGDYGLLETDSRKLMHQVVTRTQSRIMRNNANKELYKVAQNIPDNGIVRLAGIKKQAKTGKLFYETAPPGHEKLSVMIDGKRKALIMPSELAKEWVENDPIVNAAVANVIGWATGTKLLKAMATGLNPEFALTNIPRDLAHIWLTTNEYSKHLIKAPFEIGRDIASVGWDAIRRKGQYLDYINEGGGMEFLTHQGKIGPLGKLGKWLGYVGETSEIMTRLALRKRAMRNGKTAQEATWIARNYLDFSQGGNWAKGLDSVVPYLNASIQGTRGIARAATTKGGRAAFTYKVAQLGTFASGLYLANKIRHPEAWDSVPARDKVNNFIFTIDRPYKDKNGEIRYPYIKIAKDQGQRAIASVFEGLMAKFMGEEVDGDQIQMSLQDLLPLIPTGSLPPVLDAWLGYASNWDFWAQKNIWRGPEVPEQMEYTKYTNPGFIEFGKKTGFSPERTKFALQQFFTYGNIYTSLIGAAGDKIFNSLTPKQKEAEMDALRQKPGFRKILKATDPYTPFEKEAEKKKLDEQGRRYEQRMELDQRVNTWLDNKTPANEKALRDFISQQDVTDRKRLRERVKYARSTYKLRDRKWWMTLQSASPEVRARIYFSRYRVADRAERKRLEQQSRKLPGLTSARFARELRKLQQEEKKNKMGG